MLSGYDVWNNFPGVWFSANTSLPVGGTATLHNIWNWCRMASSLTKWYTGDEGEELLRIFWENAASSLHLYPLTWICCVYRISCTLVLAIDLIFSRAQQLRLLYNSFDHSSCNILIYYKGFFPTVEATSSCGYGYFCWVLPLFSVLCLLLLVCFPMTKRKSGWGICGSSVVMMLLWYGCCPKTTVLYTYFDFLNTSLSVRTEPWAISAKPEEKKKACVDMWITSWNPKSYCVYGPENEIVTMTFFTKTSTTLTNRSAFASPTKWQDPGEHRCWFKVSSLTCILSIFAKVSCYLELFGSC